MTDRTKGILVIVCTVAYLLMPLDGCPDFIPVAGQADDLLMAYWGYYKSKLLLSSNNP